MKAKIYHFYLFSEGVCIYRDNLRTKNKVIKNMTPVTATEILNHCGGLNEIHVLQRGNI